MAKSAINYTGLIPEIGDSFEGATQNTTGSLEGIDTKLGELNINKADLINGKIPIDQIPLFMNDFQEGYYKTLDNLMYKDSGYTILLDKLTDVLYLDLNTKNQYRYTGTIYEYVGTGAEATPSSNGLMSAFDKKKLDKKPYTFNTVADMQTATWLVEGDTIQLLGYYENDGAGHYRKIEISDDGSGIAVGSFFANYICKNNTVIAEHFGVKTGITNKIKKIADYCNLKNYNLKFSSYTPENPLIFDEIFQIKNTKLYSDSLCVMKYIGTDESLKPVITIGETLENSSPSRFKTSKKYIVGECLEFSNGAYGEFLFESNGYAYFHLKNDSTLLATGTVTGKTSLFTESYTEGRVSVFNGGTKNACASNIYLTTALNLNVNGFANSHKQNIGILINLCAGARRSSSFGNVTTEGLFYGIIMTHSWFNEFNGNFVANLCANGIYFVEECNALDMKYVVAGSCGTYYDSIKRASVYMAFTYSNNFNLDMEQMVRDAKCIISSNNSTNIMNSDIEGCKYTSFMEFRGASFLNFVTHENYKHYYLNNTILKARVYDSLGVTPLKYIKNLELDCSFIMSDNSLGTTYESLVYVQNSDKIDGLKLKISCNNIDFKTSFETLYIMDGKIVFDNSHIKKENLEASFYKKINDTNSFLFFKIDNKNSNVKLKNLSIQSDTGNANFNFELFYSDGTQTIINNISNTDFFTSPYHYTNNININKKIEYIRVRLQNLSTVGQNIKVILICEILEI